MRIAAFIALILVTAFVVFGVAGAVRDAFRRRKRRRNTSMRVRTVMRSEHDTRVIGDGPWHCANRNGRREPEPRGM